jgi:X-X-X-Leu-X-X-Gly heptad repeat protein
LRVVFWWRFSFLQVKPLTLKHPRAMTRQIALFALVTLIAAPMIGCSPDALLGSGDDVIMVKDGTNQVKDGTNQVKDGTNQVKDGTNQVKDGTNQFAG